MDALKTDLPDSKDYVLQRELIHYVSKAELKEEIFILDKKNYITNTKII